MKEKSPAFQFYPKDFLTDDKVIEMSAEVRGLYITLLCVDWLNDGFYGSAILKLSGFDWLTDGGGLRDDHKTIEAQLLCCFVPHPTKEGYVTNPRLQKERAAQEERRNERIAAGKKGAAVKWAQPSQKDGATIGTAITLPMAKDGSSSSSSSSSSNTNIYSPPPFTIENENATKSFFLWVKHRAAKKKPIGQTEIDALQSQWAHDVDGFVRSVNICVANGWHNLRPIPEDVREEKSGKSQHFEKVIALVKRHGRAGWESAKSEIPPDVLGAVKSIGWNAFCSAPENDLKLRTRFFEALK